MYNSILQFTQNDIYKIEASVRDLLDGKKDAADLLNEIHARVLNLGRRLISEIYELIDDEIFNSFIRKNKYYLDWRIHLHI